ncbi:hypothetical protein AFLA70_368g000511 [Aspergillus flavus AF70]|nr:hypothetical protein AFLA70_368g000511 [Aspergillus flavus AF70]
MFTIRTTNSGAHLRFQNVEQLNIMVLNAYVQWLCEGQTHPLKDETHHRYLVSLFLSIFSTLFFGDFLEMDFISCQDGLRLKRFSSPNLLLSSLELCNAYLTVLSRGESLTYYLGEQQSSIFLEERFRTLFCTNPPLLSPWYNQRTNILAWIGLLRHLDPKQLQIDADGICRCRIQEHTIEVSESAYHMLKSGILQEFIQRWPLWGDPQKEIEITEQSIAEASKWHGFALQDAVNNLPAFALPF